MVLDRKGKVHLELAFSKGDSGGTKVDGSALSKVELECQNCMEPFQIEVKCEISVEVVTDESKLQKLDQIEDAIVEPGKLISVADLVEDHLILALPMIPRHEIGKCLGTAYKQQKGTFLEDRGKEEEKNTYRPFADLAKVIKKPNPHKV